MQPEKSTSFSGGVVVTPGGGFNLTVDYYNIAMKNRIILGKEIRGTGDPANPVDQKLAAAQIVSLIVTLHTAGASDGSQTASWLQPPAAQRAR